MIGAVGGTIMTCGLIAAVIIADVPVGYVALAPLGVLGAAVALTRLRGQGRHAARRARAAAARPRWTDKDREWLRERGAVLAGPQEKAGPR